MVVEYRSEFMTPSVVYVCFLLPEVVPVHSFLVDGAVGGA